MQRKLMECDAAEYEAATQCSGMKYNAMTCSGMVKNAMEWNEMTCSGMKYHAIQGNVIACRGMEGNATDWNGMNAVEWTSTQCNAVERNAMECNAMKCSAVQCGACTGVSSLGTCVINLKVSHQETKHFGIPLLDKPKCWPKLDALFGCKSPLACLCGKPWSMFRNTQMERRLPGWANSVHILPIGSWFP